MSWNDVFIFLGNLGDQNDASKTTKKVVRVGCKEEYFNFVYLLFHNTLMGWFGNLLWFLSFMWV